MKEITKIYLAETQDETKELGTYATGLVLESSDGMRYAVLRSNDAIEPYHKL
jgi:hypothetical protein